MSTAKSDINYDKKTKRFFLIAVYLFILNILVMYTNNFIITHCNYDIDNFYTISPIFVFVMYYISVSLASITILKFSNEPANPHKRIKINNNTITPFEAVELKGFPILINKVSVIPWLFNLFSFLILLGNLPAPINITNKTIIVFIICVMIHNSIGYLIMSVSLLKVTTKGLTFNRYFRHVTVPWQVIGYILISERNNDYFLPLIDVTRISFFDRSMNLICSKNIPTKKLDKHKKFTQQLEELGGSEGIENVSDNKI